MKRTGGRLLELPTFQATKDTLGVQFLVKCPLKDIFTRRGDEECPPAGHTDGHADGHRPPSHLRIPSLASFPFPFRLPFISRYCFLSHSLSLPLSHFHFWERPQIFLHLFEQPAAPPSGHILLQFLCGSLNRETWFFLRSLMVTKWVSANWFYFWTPLQGSPPLTVTPVTVCVYCSIMQAIAFGQLRLLI